MTIYRDVDSEVILNGRGVTGRRLHGQNGCEYVHLAVQSGSTVAPHSLSFAVTFYVLTGTGTLYLNGAQYEVNKGDLVEVEGGASREWRNNGSGLLSFLVIKHPFST